MNFNNMNRYGTSAGTAEGTFGAAEGTFGGNCDRNKLGQLLVANIAALLNKKGESESESESERKATIPVIKVPTRPIRLGKKGLRLLEDQFNAEDDLRLEGIQREEEIRKMKIYQQDQEFQNRARNEQRGRQLPGVNEELLAQNAESFIRGQVSDEQRMREELGSASGLQSRDLQLQLPLPDVVTQAEKLAIETRITDIGALLNMGRGLTRGEKLVIPADATYEEIIDAAQPLIEALGIQYEE